MTTRLLSLLVTFLVVFAACGEDNKVGEGVDLNIKDQVNNQRLGATTTTTTAAPTETSAPQSAAVGRATTTTAAPATTVTTAAPAPTTTAKPAPALEIEINGDGAGTSQFAPSQARVYVGTTVKWTNVDSVARSVEADDGSFSSGSIAPGATFEYKADKVGRFNYHDGTRPYAVAALEVLAR
jgi:plastocyanin